MSDSAIDSGPSAAPAPAFLRGWGAVLVLLPGVILIAPVIALTKVAYAFLDERALALLFSSQARVVGFYWFNFVLALAGWQVLFFVRNDVIQDLRRGIGDWRRLAVESLRFLLVFALWYGVVVPAPLWGEYSVYDGHPHWIGKLSLAALMIAANLLAWRWRRSVARTTPDPE